MQFVGYGFYGKRIDELTPAESARTERFLVETEARWGRPFPPGHDPVLTFMSHVWEPLRVHHKPLVSPVFG